MINLDPEFQKMLDEKVVKAVETHVHDQVRVTLKQIILGVLTSLIAALIWAIASSTYSGGGDCNAVSHHQNKPAEVSGMHEKDKSSP